MYLFELNTGGEDRLVLQLFDIFFVVGPPI